MRLSGGCARAGAAVLLLALFACTKLPPAAPPAETAAEAAPPPVVTTPGPERGVDGKITPETRPLQPLFREEGRAAVAGGPGLAPGRATVGPEGEVTLNYVDTDIREIVRLILGDILKVNYSIDPGYQGIATIRTARPLRREELLPTLQNLVAQAGGTVFYQDGMFRIAAAGNDTIIPPLVDAASSGSGSQVVALRYASAKQLAAMLEPYVGEGAKLLADPNRNVLVIRGSAAARQNLVDLIRVFDTDSLAGQSYALFPVKTGDPAKIATDLQAALQTEGDSPAAGALKVVAIEQANAIMVIAQQPSYLDRAQRLIAQLDRVQELAGRSLHVYYVKNVQATDLQPLLQRAVNPPAGGGGETPPGSLPPTAQPAQVAAAPSGATGGAGYAGQAPTGATGFTGGATGTGLGISTAFNQASPGQGGAAATPSQTPQTSPEQDLGQQVQGPAKGPQIIADPKSNALIIVATEAEYATIEAAARRLDVLPLQVLIEATVAEVTLNDALSYGTQFFLSRGSTQFTLSNAQSATPTAIDTTTPVSNAQLFPGTIAPNFPGFAIARTLGSAQYALEALKSITDVRIVSAPKLLILDKQQAQLQVGDLVPIITSTATSVVTANATLVNNVQYQQTGVILNVTPRINSGGLVTLDIDQEVSNVVPTTSSTINSPTFQQRKIQSRIIVQNGDTISLAGLISDRKENDSTGIPLLGDIPIVNLLFSTKTHSTARTELLVLITPHVIYDQRDARAITDELKRRLAPANIKEP